MNPAHIYIKEYEYLLPHDRIAEFPLAQRDQSKLLVYKSGKIFDSVFYNLPEYIAEGTTLVLNNTRVIEARLLFKKPTGGIIEIFCLEPHQSSMEEAMQQTRSSRWHCLIGGASKWKPGQILKKELSLDNKTIILQAHYIAKEQDYFIIEFDWTPVTYAFADILHMAGAIPLPPYIKRAVEASDAERYQTIFAENKGSVAAPTAALHFTPEVFYHLHEKHISTDYITLHVGAGTFKPVKTETMDQHPMHSEHFTVTIAALQQLLQAKEIIAVGTTSLRTLESLHWIGVKTILHPDISLNDLQLAQWEAYELATHHISYKESLQALLSKMQEQQQQQLFCETSLLIVPGYSFQIPTGLITNFHQPQSTLLLLIAAFIGEDWKKIYDHALQNDYRFLSYGDSSLLLRDKRRKREKGSMF